MKRYEIRGQENRDKTLLDLLREAGASLRADCGGRGTCGKCRVLAEGEEILACRCVPERDMTVLVPEEDPLAVELGGAPEGAGAGSGPYAFCVDLGTTTVAASLLDGSGRRIARAGCGSGQRVYGADVVSRIEAALAGRAEELRELARADVARLRAQCLGKTKKTEDTEHSTYLCGNTAMLALYAGRETAGLARAPYRADTGILRTAEGETLLPGIGPFTGADLLGGIAVLGLDRTEHPVLFLDCGTNSEIALCTPEVIYVTSAAAGPALEGAGIRCGMAAAEGAVTGVQIAGMHAACRTIGGGEAKGLCGSGVVSAVSELLRNGLVAKNGLLAEEFFEEGYPLAPGIFFTQEDVRSVQTAKAAVRAGAELLLHKSGIPAEAVETVYLAGGFGAHLDPAEVTGIGLVDPLYGDRILQPGNTSLAAAEAFARGELTEERLAGIRQKATEVTAAEEPFFAEAFIRRMDF